MRNDADDEWFSAVDCLQHRSTEARTSALHLMADIETANVKAAEGVDRDYARVIAEPPRAEPGGSKGPPASLAPTYAGGRS